MEWIKLGFIFIVSENRLGMLNLHPIVCSCSNFGCVFIWVIKIYQLLHLMADETIEPFK